jgi:uncharacterized repeat protein (TIGR03803 family)
MSKFARHHHHPNRVNVFIGILAGFATMGMLSAQTPATGHAVPAAATMSTLYEFTGGGDGGFPQASVAISSTSGVLYGTTYEGGKYGWGAVYQLTPPVAPSTTWIEKTIYSFTGGNDGANPSANLLIGPTGVLYGTAYNGGSSGYGVVFSLVPGTGGVWTESVLHTFTGGNDGANPAAGLISTKNGVYFGTTYNGGTSGYGTVFQLVYSGTAWNENILFSFTGGTDGANPTAGLTSAGASGVLYGTTYGGGTSGLGTVFELLPPSSSSAPWTEKPLYSFTGGTDGANPQSGIILGKLNVLYGSAFWAGSSTACLLGGYPAGCGTLFELLPPATKGGTWTQKVLYTFTGGTDGAHPYETMSQASAGGLYGSAFSGGSGADVCFPASYPGCGAVYALLPPTTQGGAWIKSGLHVFMGDDGGGPNGIVLGSNGTLYGTTYNGGALGGGYGTVFSLVP